MSPNRILGRQETPTAVARALARSTLEGLAGPVVSVLDPSCGRGPLLRAAAEEGARLGLRVRLAGTDKDPEAVEEARAELAGLDAKLRVQDALAASARPLLALAPGRRAFDAVIANPPWVSFSGRHSVAIDKKTRAQLKARFESFARWPQLQGPFLERAIEVVRPLGRVGFVLPRQVLDLDGYGPVRRVATERARVVAVSELGEDIFAGVCEPSATVVLERTDDDVMGDASEAPWTRVSSPRPLARWAARVLDRLARFPRFGKEHASDPGVHTGNAASCVIKDTPVVGFLPCREGKDVKRYALASPRIFVREKPELEPPLYARVKPLERYLETDVLVRQTADRPIAARHAPRTFFRNSCLAVRAPAGVPVEVVLALLNSRLFALDHRARTADARQRSFPQVKVGALAALPFPALLTTADVERLGILVRRREALGSLDTTVVYELEREIERAVGRLFRINDDDALAALEGWLA